jgi:hypothetical protein
MEIRSNESNGSPVTLDPAPSVSAAVEVLAISGEPYVTSVRLASTFT